MIAKTAARRAWLIDISVVAALSVLVRLPWLLVVHPTSVGDSRFYYLSARSIAEGHGYQILGHPTAFFPVGWPAFLGGLFYFSGPSMLAIEVLNVVLWALVAALVYVLGWRLGGRAVGVVAGILVAVSPTMMVFVMRAYSEALFIPLLLGVCLLLIWRRETPSLRSAALAGVLLGASILVRSTAEALIVILPLWLLWRRPRRESWRAALVLGVAACLTLAPWLVRNVAVMHTTSLSTNGGVTLWLGANPRANGGWIPYGKNSWAISSAADEVKQNDELTREAFRYAVHNPRRYLGLMPDKFTRLMAWSTYPVLSAELEQKGPDPRVPHSARTSTRKLTPAERKLLGGALNNTWAFELWHYLYWSLGAVALLLAAWRRRPGADLAVLLVAFWILFHVILVHGEPRYMLSVTPLVAPALAWLLVSTWRRLQPARS
ncbi:MAG: ArnT family glycosyltransferase [Gaiellaceae bacterium]